MTQPIGPRAPAQNAFPQITSSAPPIRVQKPGSFAVRTATAVRIRLPPLNQFRMQDTYWAGRWGVHTRALVATFDKNGKGSLRRLLKALTTAVEGAPYGYSRSTAAPIRAAHKRLRQALKAVGARPRQLRTLDRHLIRYEQWWRTSGATACGLAAQRALQLVGAKPTRLGRLTTGTRRRLFSSTPLQAGYLKQRRRRVAKRYKGRYVTYEARYTRSRLQRAARRIISRLRSGQPVHARVLSGYLHRDTGRRPRASHSLVIDGYVLTQGTTGAPGKVDFHFTDPDGGGDGVLRLDVTTGRFEHIPANVGWCDRGPDGWDYDSVAPPYRYQVLSIR